jgi:hypothetical protein
MAAFYAANKALTDRILKHTYFKTLQRQGQVAMLAAASGSHEQDSSLAFVRAAAAAPDDAAAMDTTPDDVAVAAGDADYILDITDD